MPVPSRSDKLIAFALACLALLALGISRSPRGRRSRTPVTSGSGAFGEPRSSDESLSLQQARALEPGRGREAMAPDRIPWRGWIDIFLRVYSGISKHRLLAVAAGAAFYGLLAIFPGITAFVSIYGLFASSAQIRYHLALLVDIVPADAVDIIGGQIDRIVAKGAGSLSLAVVVSLALSLWSANAGIKALFDALNVIYDEDEKRSFLRLNVVSLLFTFCVITFMVTSLIAVVVVPLILSRFGLDPLSHFPIAALRWPFLFVIVALGISALYRFGPSRRPPKWRWVSIGSVVGAIAWLAGSVAFSWYLGNVADFNATYGSLGAAIGLMMWLWLSAVVVLLGAQFNAEIEHQTARDSTIGEVERPLGQRQAVMADTVGEALA
jgi:membrane protein